MQLNNISTNSKIATCIFSKSFKVSNEFWKNKFLDYQTETIIEMVLSSKNSVNKKDFHIYNSLFLINDFEINSETVFVIQECHSSINDLTSDDIHDVKNLINNLSLLLLNYEEPAIKRFFPSIKKNINTVNEILNKKSKTDGTSFIDFQKLKNDIIDVFSFYEIYLNIHFSPNLNEYKLLANQDILFRVFYNIILNSIEASNRNSQIDIEGVIKSENFIFSIKDYGSGLKADSIEHILKRGFSTKINHSGLGLSFVQDNVKKYFGNFNIKSEFGKGTEIQLEFPNFDKLINSLNLKLVIIDDDKLFLNLITEIVKDYSINITTFNSLENIENSISTFTKNTVIVLDKNIGDSNSQNLIDAKFKGTNFPIILISGENIEDIEINNKISSFLQKPFDFEELMAKSISILFF